MYLGNITKAAIMGDSEDLQGKKYFIDVGIPLDTVHTMSSLTINTIYQKLKGQFEKFSWKGVICVNQGASKWIFILRLVALGRIYTCDRLTKWGMDIKLTMPTVQYTD